MGTFPDRNLNQTAVYWGAPVADGYGGTTFDDPIEIPCRWQSSTKTVTTFLGELKIVNAEVQVDRDLEEQGMLLLGSLDDLDSGDYNDPTNAGARPIVRFDKVPTIKADAMFRKAYV